MAKNKKKNGKKSKKHEYLNQIGIKSTETCIFNTAEIEMKNGKKTKRQKRFAKQREKYGFDERETWALDYTLATWLHSHLKMYLEVSIVNLEFHHFDIPVLEPIPEEEREYHDINKTLPKQCTREVMKNVTQKEAINLMIEYLERYIKHGYDCDANETLADESMKCAMKIWTEVLPTMWW